LLIQKSVKITKINYSVSTYFIYCVVDAILILHLNNHSVHKEKVIA